MKTNLPEPANERTEKMSLYSRTKRTNPITVSSNTLKGQLSKKASSGGDSYKKIDSGSSPYDKSSKNNSSFNQFSDKVQQLGESAIEPKRMDASDIQVSDSKFDYKTDVVKKVSTAGEPARKTQS